MLMAREPCLPPGHPEINPQDRKMFSTGLSTIVDNTPEIPYKKPQLTQKT
jgi:hypothetical protein